MNWLPCCSRGEFLHCLSKHGTAMCVVAEHVQTRARGGEQHHVAGLRAARGGAHCIFKRGADFHCADVTKHARNCECITTDENGVPHLAAESVGKR